MATIYRTNGEYITQGLQGCDICDEAIITARRIAKNCQKDVILDDDDGLWLVSPDGTATSVTAKEVGFE